MARVLLADDDPGSLLMLSHFLRQLGHEVEVASCEEEALLKAPGLAPEVAVLDWNLLLPDAGLRVGVLLRRALPMVRIVFVSGYDESDLRDRAGDLEVSAFLTKPIDLGLLSELLLRVSCVRSASA
jgi:CheY-like chemotaxis protein